MLITASCKNRYLGNLLTGGLHWQWPNGEALTYHNFGPDLVKGKRVCVFVHGLKNTDANAIDAYQQIMNRANATYDVGVGFLWPAGATPFAYPWVSVIPKIPASKALREVLRVVHSWKPSHLDLNGHSLGAGIAMGGLLYQSQEVAIDNVWLLAGCMLPQLDDYREAVRQHVRGNVNVLYSRDDAALAASWMWLPPGPKLGEIGEHSFGPNLANSIDYTAEVGFNHNGYRKSSRFYQALVDSSVELSRM